MKEKEEILIENLIKLPKSLRTKLNENLKNQSQKEQEKLKGIESLLNSQEEEYIIQKYKEFQQAKQDKKKANGFQEKGIPGLGQLKEDKQLNTIIQQQTLEFMDKYNQIFKHMKENQNNSTESKFYDLISIYREKGWKLDDIDKMKNIFNPSLLLIENNEIDNYYKSDGNIDDKTTQEFKFLNNIYKLSFQKMNSASSVNAITRSNEKFANDSCVVSPKELTVLKKERMATQTNIDKVNDYLNNFNKELKRDEIFFNINSVSSLSLKDKRKDGQKKKRLVMNYSNDYKSDNLEKIDYDTIEEKIEVTEKVIVQKEKNKLTHC